MNTKIQNIIKNGDDYVTTYNNIDVNFGLTFNNLSYTLSYENTSNINHKKYLNNNTLLFNIEDVESIYNIFWKNDIKFAYQLNNILFINNEQKINILNYNPKSLTNFSINNNVIKFNVLNNDSSLNNFNEQTIYSNTYNNYSYIYSNEDRLNFASINKQGLYCVDNNNVVINNDRLSLDFSNFDYNHKYINNVINKISYVIHDYNNNIELFTDTNKYKDNTNTNNLVIYDINKFKNKKYITITTLNSSFKFEYKYIYLDYNYAIGQGNQYVGADSTNSPKPKNSIYDFNEMRQNNCIYLKDTNSLIIDFPIEYQYETVINNNLEFHKILCPVKINDIKYKIYNDFITISLNNDKDYQKYANSISIDKSKCFVHNNKCISITETERKQDATIIVNESCNVSLYFNISDFIYEYAYKHSKDKNMPFYLFTIEIEYRNVWYLFGCYVDVMHKQFKKLYHNYNYGFNYDNHGDAIGIMLLPKNESDVYVTNNILFDDILKTINNNNIKLINTNKDIFVSYDKYSIDNIFVNIDNIDYNKINKFGVDFFNYLIAYSDTSTNMNEDDINILDPKFVLDKLYNPERLKLKNFIEIYKSNNVTINKYKRNNGFYYLLNNAFIDDHSETIKLYNYNYNYNILNNMYNMNHDNQNTLFNNIYNFRKSGLLFGDMNVPCTQEYLLMYLFDIENYFDYNIYKQYKNRIEKFNKIEDETQHECRFLTNQFYKNFTNNNILQYSLKINNNSELDLNNDNNNYRLDLYDSKNMTENQHNYIWPTFKIPDFSIINSNNYVIMFSETENCEYVDYYVKDTKHLYFNYRSYYDIDENFVIISENLKNDGSIQVIGNSLVDKNNDIYSLDVYMKNSVKLKIFYICYIDSENSMNNFKVGNKKYRILCKVFVKNESV